MAKYRAFYAVIGVAVYPLMYQPNMVVQTRWEVISLLPPSMLGRMSST